VVAVASDAGDDFEEMLGRREELLRIKDEGIDTLGGLNTDEDEELVTLTDRELCRCWVSALPCLAMCCVAWHGTAAWMLLPASPDALLAFTSSSARCQFLNNLHSGSFALLPCCALCSGCRPCVARCVPPAAGLLKFGYLEDTDNLDELEAASDTESDSDLEEDEETDEDEEDSEDDEDDDDVVDVVAEPVDVVAGGDDEAASQRQLPSQQQQQWPQQGAGGAEADDEPARRRYKVGPDMAIDDILSQAQLGGAGESCQRVLACIACMQVCNHVEWCRS
jgi:hypothetical protein